MDKVAKWEITPLEEDLFEIRDQRTLELVAEVYDEADAVAIQRLPEILGLLREMHDANKEPHAPGFVPFTFNPRIQRLLQDLDNS